MGSWFAGFLSKNGYRIIISDSNKHLARNLARKEGFQFLEDPKLAVQLAQLVVLAMPSECDSKEFLSKST